MAEYSKSDKQAMRTAFRKLFECSSEVSLQPQCRDWMENAPIGIVEYDGMLENEDVKGRDRRMEMQEVYSGNVKPLVDYLRGLYPAFARKSTKWEVIFIIYNGIMDASTVVEQAAAQVAFDKGGTQEILPATEESQNRLDTSKENPIETAMNPPEETIEQEADASIEMVSGNIQPESTTETAVEEPTLQVEQVQPAQQVVEPTPVQETVAQQIQPAVSESVSQQMDSGEFNVGASVVSPSGSVDMQNEHPYSNINTEQNKEVTQMSDANSMLNNLANMGAQMNGAGNGASAMVQAAMQSAGGGNPAGGTVNPAATQTPPAKSNVAKTKEMEEAKAFAVQHIMDNKDARNAWTRQNVVTNIISTMLPAAKRIKQQTGSACGGETDATKAKEAVVKKINKFISAVSGRENITMDQFETLPDDQKYANVYVADGSTADPVGKAAAMYELYKEILQNPTGQYTAYIPNDDNISYPARGYELGGRLLTEGEFMREIAENGTDGVYGEGYMDPNGCDVGDKPVKFLIRVAKRKEKAASTGITTQQASTRVPVVRPVNKKEFVKGGSHVKYLFEQADAAEANVSFKAAIMHGGEAVAATVSVYKLKNGQKELREGSTAEKPKYKTKVVSVSISVPVTKIKKEFGVQYVNGNESVILTAKRWGVSMGNGSASTDLGNISDMQQTAAVELYGMMAKGLVKVTDAFKGAPGLENLKNVANQQMAAEAQASASELE